MRYNWSRYLRLILAGIAGTTLIGWYFGFPLYGLLTGLTVYLWWTLLQARRLYQWLGNPSASDEPPQSIGMWGHIFDSLHKLHQGHLSRQDSLRSRINRVQDSTNSMREGVIMTNTKGEMEWWNDAAEYLLGFRRGTDRGQYIQNLIRSPAFKTYFDKRDYAEPLELNSPAKPHIYLEFQINQFGDDDRLIVAKDVTRLHQLEQMRRDFIGNVSHEMRTPLTVISGYLETMVDHGEELPAKWRRAVQTMATQSSRMEALITDLILLSMIETGEHSADQESIDVKAMIGQIGNDARALSGDKNHHIDISVAGQPLLKGDHKQLRSAFSNLVFNAVKYTPPGGRITVTWRSDRDGAHLSVKDTGIGIDSTHIPRLTERFYRADPSRHQDTGGTGLGLAIVKHVLINHDGHLEINSRVGEGSEFTCHFPKGRVIEGVPEQTAR
ncbi:Phosphate regulon sensor protein PhoR [Marinobacter litoralis]|uniref:Phosphate regulon sensor protein PhoR n=1 Tax=Marinobacter litoralis TaxID=187981 RepID=A0A3M2RCZ9_9GAMM|nr:phosphate regulon sensor histidine kinase PhoR [Marinobacter litoralis]RMJ03167.1 Phosphate regulon sensor protein PhoR [Marinobacter litoralis]